MSEHKANIIWARNGVDFGYKNYPRDHVWRFPNGVELHPKIAYSGAKQPAAADLEWLHDKGSAQRGAGTRCEQGPACGMRPRSRS